MKWKGLDIDPRLISESTVVKPKLDLPNGMKVQEMTTEGGVRYLLPRIEAIHAGTTRNNTRYLADKLKGHEELKSGVFSWTQPYPKPIIYNHDVETEATGRVHTASFSEFTAAGRPGIIVVPKISHPKAIQDIMDGRLLTVSIGATTDSAVCTVCGTDIINEGFCGHYRGESYEDQTCEWVCGNLWFDELSWVNVPADQDAMIVDAGAMFTPTASASRESVTVTGTVQESGQQQKTQEERDEKEMEELQKQIEELRTQHEELTKQVESLESEKATLVAEKDALVAEKEEVVKERDELKESLATATSSVEEANTKLSETEKALEEKTAELETAKTSLEEEKQSREQLVTANTELAGEVQESKVQHLVDLRLALGKEASKEEALAKFKGRSVESLNDSIADLEGESPVTVTRTVEHIEHPNQGTQTTLQTTENTKAAMTAEDMLKKLLGGKR